MNPIPEAASFESESTYLSTLAKKPLLRALGYLLRRAVTIGLTIVAGIFIAVVIANRGGMLDKAIRAQIDRQMYAYGLGFLEDLTPEQQAQRAGLERASGLSLSFWPKHILYTVRSLRMDWGDVTDQIKFLLYQKTEAGEVGTLNSRTIILARLPNTLLLAGTAYLLLTLLGLPLALYLSRHEGGRLDRLLGVLTPLSSVPSWVLGVLLVLVFAAQLRLFPAGKMYGLLPPQTTAEAVLTVAYHMVLPVLAIVLSLVFQMIFNWRTYLLIYSEENYVILARAKGLKQSAVDLQYILRPVLPYMLTSLVLTLVGFWQTLTALEFFFQWPGIGKLFVDALPNFHSESMYSGEMSLVVGVVVLFAYLLGVAVFLFDFLYVLVDPRLRAGANGAAELNVAGSGQRRRGWPRIRFVRRARRPIEWRVFADDLRRTAQRVGRELRREPLAILGLALVSLLVLLAIAVSIVIPYEPVGRLWSESNLTGRPTRARLAQPLWVNWFRKVDLPPTFVLGGAGGTAYKQVTMQSAEMSRVEIEFNFDFPYSEFPADMVLYLSSNYATKAPLVALTWITPDGREINLKNATVAADLNYAFEDNVPMTRLLRENPAWKTWVVTSGNDKTPGYQLLFAGPRAGSAAPQPGLYTLRVNGYVFEPDSDIDAQLVVFGKVEGWAGTDYMRRDLIVPLLWGLPFALLIGVLGAVLTAVVSLILAAAAAWLGGWVDALVQRLNEANLVLPVMAIGVLLYSYYNLNLWLILGLIVALNIFGSPTKAFRAAFLQEKQVGYIEAARVYGAGDGRIISGYLLPRILPVVIPQIIILIPNFFFLEATLAIFNISDPRYPTWGRVVYSALRYGAAYGSQFWVLEPIAMMLITGLAFALLGLALNRVLNPLLRDV